MGEVSIVEKRFHSFSPTKKETSNELRAKRKSNEKIGEMNLL